MTIQFDNNSSTNDDVQQQQSARPSAGISVEVRKRKFTESPSPKPSGNTKQPQQDLVHYVAVKMKSGAIVESPLMTIKEAAAYLRLEVCTLRKWAHQKKPGTVLPVRIGKKVMYAISELNAYILCQQQQPVEE